MHRLTLAILAATAAFGQTEIDLHTQSKSVDFTGATFTRPIKTGTSLPVTCAPGDMFFLTNAPAGLNLYGCTTTNNFSLQSGGGSGGGGGSFTIENNGSLVGARGVANFISGSGLVNALSDTGSQINIQQSVDTSVIASKATAQSGSMWLCSAASGSPIAYTCSMNPTLTAYTTGMFLNFKPDVNGAGGAMTVNVDTLGAVALKSGDGVTNPGPLDLAAGHLYPVWFDGAAFRLLPPGDTITTPNGSMVVGGTPGGTTLDVNTAYLNTLYPQLSSINTYSAGAEQVLQPSATTPALRITGGAIPTSNPHVAGEWMTSPAGRALWADGVNDQYVVSIAGASITPPAPPPTGHLAVWGPGYTVSDGGAVPTVTHAIRFNIGTPGGSALTAGATTTDYFTAPYACTISAYNLLLAPAGTVTVKFWKVSTGLAIPTSSNSISTNGVSITSGTAIHGTALSDFTTTAVSANDIMAMNVTAVSSASYVQGVLQCQ